MSFTYEHCANSAAIIDVEDARFDIVSAGISTYGLYPSDEVKKDAVHLKPALALKSHVAFVKEIESGNTCKLRRYVCCREENENCNCSCRIR